MFKTLLATLMLSTSFGTPLIKTTPRKAVEQSGTQINGYYNLRDEMEWPNQYGSFYIKQNTDNFDMYVFYIDTYYQVNEMKFNYSFQNAPNYVINIQTTIYDWYEDETTTVTWTSSGTNGEFNKLENYNIYFKEMILYFPSSFYYTESRDNAFFYFFTTQNNNYITSYNGYFNFALNYTGTNLDLKGNFIIDNSMYFEIWDKDTGDMYANYNFYNEGNTITKHKRIFGTNIAPKNRNIFMQIQKIPNSQKQQLEQFGVFAYVQPVQDETTFSGFFFSIMDAPIYYLSSLFSFELFGVNMFMALTSLLTLMILIIVIKKVV